MLSDDWQVVASRFLRLTRKTYDGCWFWEGSKCLSNGRYYGRFWLDGRSRPAAQVAWEIRHEQPFPEGKEACHTCDVPMCVNPAHIFPGTRSDNMLDAVAKGRHQAARITHCPNGHEYTPENTYEHPSGRKCWTCVREQNAKWNADNRERRREIDRAYRERKRLAAG